MSAPYVINHKTWWVLSVPPQLVLGFWQSNLHPNPLKLSEMHKQLTESEP